MNAQRTDIVIIGAGPAGIFAVFEAGQLGLRCHVIDVLNKPGGQCLELYPEKPIYDIPGIPHCTGASLIQGLLAQVERFEPVFHLGEQANDLVKTAAGRWLVSTCAGTRIEADAVIIAAGAGSFTPRRLTIESSADYESDTLLYAVKDPLVFKDKNLIILGGGDSALDWAIALEKTAARITLAHRRNVFKAAPDSIDKMQALVEQKRIGLKIASATALHGAQGQLTHVTLSDNSGQQTQMPCDYILAFFGLTNKLGPINEWGIALNEDKIAVNPATMQTNLAGVYAIGDITEYPGKLNLILTGFHEAAVMSHAAYQYIKGQKPRFQYSTHSDILHTTKDTAQERDNALNESEACTPTNVAVDDCATGLADANTAPALHVRIQTLDGIVHTLPAKTGQTLLEIIDAEKLPIKGSCYGCCNCSTCHVYVHDDWIESLPAMLEQEQEALDQVTQPKSGSRLACQIEFNPGLSGLHLTLTEDTIPD